MTLRSFNIMCQLKNTFRLNLIGCLLYDNGSRSNIAGQHGGVSHSRGSDLELLFLFMHMTKNAGTSFRVRVENNLAEDEILPLYIDIDLDRLDRLFG